MSGVPDRVEQAGRAAGLAIRINTASALDSRPAHRVLKLAAAWEAMFAAHLRDTTLPRGLGRACGGGNRSGARREVRGGSAGGSRRGTVARGPFCADDRAWRPPSRRARSVEELAELVREAANGGLMRAAAIGKFGPAERLTIRQVPTLVTSPGEVLVRVDATGRDRRVPADPGHRVCRADRPGRCRGDRIRDRATGCRTPGAGLLRGARSGEPIVIHGTAGGAGSTAVQLARHNGSRVTGTGSEENQEYFRTRDATPMVCGEGELDRLRTGSRPVRPAASRAVRFVPAGDRPGEAPARRRRERPSRPGRRTRSRQGGAADRLRRI
ncbi:hypothetical protein SAMN05421854_103154 [Amycolatopsis rubida]|uniref:Zinc-binding dehydrogenase n=1 Tax=Amycolatopsis rubida TaxID=112413 RepID=A0A1I5KEE9_9PSEU|nr:hypothetical protein SAMN05421854_103154 [Amycolatopsis rubida]